MRRRAAAPMRAASFRIVEQAAQPLSQCLRVARRHQVAGHPVIHHVMHPPYAADDGRRSARHGLHRGKSQELGQRAGVAIDRPVHGGEHRDGGGAVEIHDLLVRGIGHKGHVLAVGKSLQQSEVFVVVAPADDSQGHAGVHGLDQHVHPFMREKPADEEHSAAMAAMVAWAGLEMLRIDPRVKDAPAIPVSFERVAAFLGDEQEAVDPTGDGQPAIEGETRAASHVRDVHLFAGEPGKEHRKIRRQGVPCPAVNHVGVLEVPQECKGEGIES